VKRLLAFGVMVLFGALSTYVWRHYLTSKDGKPSPKQVTAAKSEATAASP
jgi:hypothetical protein